MKLRLNTIHVKDLKESVQFYQNILKMDKMKEFSPRTNTTIVFLKGEADCIIELIEDKETSFEENTNSNFSIGFTVEDMDKTINNLKNNNIKIVRGPIEVSGNTKLAFIKDPNGIDIEFVENLGL